MTNDIVLNGVLVS